MRTALAFLRARPPLGAALLVLAVLLATTDERSFGVIPDGKEMLSAGAAVALRGELGVSRDFVNAAPREGGDGFSRYGMGQSLAEVPFFWAARILHAASPAIPSTPVFVLLPLLSLVAAAWGVARAAGNLGASPGAQLFAGASLVLATPLWGYAGSDFSEPLQAALVGLSLAAVSTLGTSPTRRGAVAAGALLGALPLVKSLLWIVAVPLAGAALLSLLRTSGKARKKGRSVPPRTGPSLALPFALGAAGPALAWLALELVRFGRPFGGYPGEDFSYPALTGFLRLTLLPNKGLLVYAPVVFLAVPGLLALRRREPALAAGLAVSVLAVLASASAWWAWDGQAAWGPRLLLSALPVAVLAGTFAFESGRQWRVAGAVALVAGAAVNALGALQPFPPVYALATAAPPQPIAEGRAAGTRYEIARRPDGTLLATGPHHLSLTPGWWPPLVHARLLSERLRGGDVADRLASGALGLTPPLVPPVPRFPGATFSQGVATFTWPFWGRSLVSRPPGLVDPLSEALADQAVRDLDTGRPDRARRALAVVLERQGTTLDPATLALAADAATRSGDAAEAGRLLARSPDPCHPWILFVRVGRGDDVGACVPDDLRPGFLGSVEWARTRGLPVSGWARQATRTGAAG